MKSIKKIPGLFVIGILLGLKGFNTNTGNIFNFEQPYYKLGFKRADNSWSPFGQLHNDRIWYGPFAEKQKKNFQPKVVFTEIELKKKLTRKQYHVTQDICREMPCTGIYDRWGRDGKYTCVVCDIEVFDSNDKYQSGCGWPTFWSGYYENLIEFIDHHPDGMKRTELHCKNCGSHLGLVFQDGPTDKGGKRFSVNSHSLNFVKKKFKTPHPYYEMSSAEMKPPDEDGFGNDWKQKLDD